MSPKVLTLCATGLPSIITWHHLEPQSACWIDRFYPRYRGSSACQCKRGDTVNKRPSASPYKQSNWLWWRYHSCIALWSPYNLDEFLLSCFLPDSRKEANHTRDILNGKRHRMATLPSANSHDLSAQSGATIDSHCRASINNGHI